MASRRHSDEAAGGSTDSRAPFGQSCPSLKSDSSRDAPLLFQKDTQPMKAPFGESCPSLKSDCSKDAPLLFRTDTQPMKSGSGESCLSLRSDCSKDAGLLFRTKPSEAPFGESCPSLKSDCSKDAPLLFRTDTQPMKSGSGESCLSLRSDCSKDAGLLFRTKPSEAPFGESCPSLKSDCSKDAPLLFRTDTQPMKSGSGESCLSLRSDCSKDAGLLFRTKPSESGSGESCLSLRSDCSKDAGLLFRTKPSEAPFGESCPSLKSDCSKDAPLLFRTDTQPMKSGSGESCLSLRSDCSKDAGLLFRTKPSEVLWSSDGFDDQPDKQLELIFMRLEEDILMFVKEQLRSFQKLLAQKSTTDSTTESTTGSGQEQNREAVLNITLDFLRRMDREHLAEQLKSKMPGLNIASKLKSELQQKCRCVFEGVAKAGSPALLQQIYTELYITEGGASEVNQEHEVRHMETASRKPGGAERAITCEDMFKGPADTEAPVRTVLTKGVAGIGKTLLTQKVSLDWAEGRAHQDVQLLFPFSFRALNVLKDRSLSLVQLLHHFFRQTQEVRCFEDLRLLFILDGLDECRLPLDFSRTRVLTEPTESASVEVLLVNLIRGSLLPSARLWITTRPAAANQIPAECVSMVTEVRGFSDEQKEQYFRKRFKDEATAVISHIKSIRSLYIMCYIPVFCWILSIVLQKILEQTEKPELPKTLTEMYVHFLVVQAKVKNIKYHGRTGADLHWTPETREMVQSLGKLAFEQLQKGNLIFYESDLSECGLDAEEIARYSGVFTQVFREEQGLYQDKVYCFIHLTVQEFLAALHVHQTFFSSGVNLLSPYHKSKRDFYNSSVRESLYRSNGHLDLFLRFLLGLSLPTNQSLLHGLLTQTGSDMINYSNVEYIKRKINKKVLSEENRLNLLHCLNELNDHSLEEQIQLSIKEGHINPSMSPAQWSALCFLLLSTDREVFDLKKYQASEEVLLKLLPVVQASKKALLSDCNLTEHSCAALSSLLSSESCTLKVLDLSNNPILDSGVERLCEGLKSTPCTLETLSLSCCNLTERSCGLLSSVLIRSSLKHLDLSNNRLQNSGLDLLCAGLKSAPCRLQSLRVSRCLVTEEDVATLVSALSSSSSLKELDLTNNNLSLCTQLTTLQGLVHTLRVEPTEVEWLSRPSQKKYYCDLSLDPNSAHKVLSVSEDCRRASYSTLKYLWFGDDQPDRFEHFAQVLCAPPLTGRCYWEVEWSGSVDIAISYRKIRRKGEDDEQEFGANDHSWCLCINSNGYTVCHNKIQTLLSSSWFGQMTHSFYKSGRVAMFLDCEAGSLSFFKCSSGKFTHLYTFRSTFTEPLYAGFGLRWNFRGSSVSLVNVRREEQHSCKET